ncbi:hypothetical protein [Mycobacterium sp.]|uniref:hypothetical protein n=1 Tax=Mycobacterium sp. TaxID=1785 RepID=UPI0031DAEE28
MPFLPAICVGLGVAAALVDGSMAAEDVIADDDEDAAELDEELLELLDWWHPAPSSANAARATENDAVLFVIARIISSRIPFESHRTRPG